MDFLCLYTLTKTVIKLMKQWQCLVCGFIYDEALGLPEENIPAGTLWTDIPEDWFCPECGVSKSEFEMVLLGE